MIENILEQLQSLEVASTLEIIFVVGILLLVVPYTIVMIKQLRLLSRFMKTPAGPVWIIIASALLLLSLGAGAWYFLV